MFKGIYTPIVTPFNEKEEIDYDRMKHNLEKWGKTDLDGIVVLGSNGEFVYLTTEEKLTLAKFVIDNFNKNKKVIAGASAESVLETIFLCEKYAELGADAVLVLPPHYFKGAMKEDVLYKYFIDVAEASSIPVMLYNMPGNTGINLSSNLISKLSKHPNIVGIKDTSGNIVQLSEIVRDTDDDFAVFAGNAGYLLPALSVGARGATLAVANILPDECCKLVKLFNEGKMDEARELQKRLLEPNFTVTGRFGVPALKYALDLLGYQGGYPRRPLLPLSEDKKRIVEEVLKNYGVL
ncbi:putative 4-hydroxy-2-oxoglutarate aldolase,mitochondrial [[Clostridium] ultunense Esp]|uniref:4-hydroxy-tetrahydrodipicolinate synthase n=1 Tax=[Clostridium] ultunense Esp TaxID=1288971 RepID=M1Z689_9FIRM|nr:4-hydroxy-tetrahydrodipicolinate synthase [Schnuerera ultunensis]CCQ93098.1 putative 4-hydroxy-2-oxoglutarate aldolase,mitochondrial [[Clostridium] ultunense Esp]SHD77883.1 putative 4-hydroxy-2-oxoglutarate aldolase,mitochondrial [[Clostridium] ultunense Esp]